MVSEKEVLDVLKKCYEPEVCVSVLDMGLIEQLEVEEGGLVRISMIMANSCCPLQTCIGDRVYAAVKDLEGVTDVILEILDKPTWTPARLSPEGKKILGV